MKTTFALAAAAVFLTSCATAGSGCITKDEAAKNFVKFDSDEVAHAYAAIPNYADKRNHRGDHKKAIAQATTAIETFDLTPKQESWFLKKRLAVFEAMSDKTGARADIKRLEGLGTLYPNEAQHLRAKVYRLGTSLDAQNDRDAQPLIRIPPIISQAALRGNKSGHCVVLFDVSRIGVPENVRVGYCTDEVFQQSSINSVSKWKYNYAIRDGVPVERKNVESKIVYAIMDACGTQLPE